MFVVYYRKGNHKKMYFNKDKEVQKTIKTATALGEIYRESFEEACKNNPTMFIQNIIVSNIAESMYEKSHVQYNQIKW